MYDLLKLLKEAIGVRPLIPLLLVVAAGLAFKTIRDYPVRELFYDRYFLITVLAIVFAAAANAVWTSALAERTPTGRYGIYVARIKGDGANRPVQMRLLEGIAANLAAKATEAQIRLEIRDLKSEMNDQDLEALPKTAAALNAAVMIWGTAIDDKTMYSRLWSQRSGVARSATPLNVAEISPLADFASLAWERVSNVLQQDVRQAPGKSEAELGKELEALRFEVAELRTRIAAGAIGGFATAKPVAENLTAILFGIGDYGGQANLMGPANDVALLQAALKTRNKAWKITTLLDRLVTTTSVEDAIRSRASSMPPDETLLVYLSGHVDPDEHGASKFYLSDLQTTIDVQTLIIKALQSHPRTLFLIDGRFDPSSLNPELMKRSAVFAAESKGFAYESTIKGKTQGAFTAALVEALDSASPGTALRLEDAYRFVLASLKKTYKDAEPKLKIGTDPPTL